MLGLVLQREASTQGKTGTSRWEWHSSGDWYVSVGVINLSEVTFQVPTRYNASWAPVLLWRQNVPFMPIIEPWSL
jgi:hypothetical protein